MAEEDPRLADFYVRPDRYVDRALSFDDPAVFFVGPKGAGKSAVLQMVRNRKASDADRLINISPDDLAFSALAQAKADIPLLPNAPQNQFIFKSLWDYVLSLEVIRRECRDRNAVLALLKKLFRATSPQANRLLQLSVSADGKPCSLSERILQLISEVGVSIQVAGAKISGNVVVDSGPGGSPHELLSLVNSVSKNLGNEIKKEYHVLIDDLDLHWTNEPTQNAFLEALFQSLRKLNSGRLKFAVALRERIYRSLPLEDKDKFRDRICRVDWDADTVRDMVAMRLAAATGIGPEQVWGKLLPERAYAALMKRTGRRPREMIRLAALCIETAKSEGHRCVEDGDVGMAITRFSEEKLEDLASEINYQYRGFDRLARKLRGGPKAFSRGRVEELAMEIALEFGSARPDAPPYKWAAVYENDPDGLARIMMEVGLLNFKANRTAIAEEYDPSSPVEITGGSWFEVHPTYSPGLKCVGD